MERGSDRLEDMARGISLDKNDIRKIRKNANVIGGCKTGRSGNSGDLKVSDNNDCSTPDSKESDLYKNNFKTYRERLNKS